jgi:hypothetical protein
MWLKLSKLSDLRLLQPWLQLHLPTSQPDGIRHPEYHKGGECIVSTKFCQEGYCSDCQIYRDYLRNKSQAAKIAST